MGETIQSTKVVTGVVRLSYAHVWEPKSINGSEPKYSVSILIPKTDKETLSKIKAAVDAAKEEGKSKWKGKIPANLKMPVRDGDTEREDDEVYEGHYFINANSSKAPQIVDLYRNPITDEDQLYSGCYARVSVNFYPFDVNGNKGIACGLNNIQKVKDGERLGGGSTAEQDFNDDFTYEEENYDFL